MLSSRQAGSCIFSCVPAMVVLIALGLTPTLSFAQRLDIDSTKSTFTLHVFKSGLFSALAHDHIIQAPVALGSIDTQANSVELTFNVVDMKVLDPGETDSNRKDIDATMKGPKVLDGAQFPTISFASSSAKASVDRTDVTGNLKIHGASRSITVPVTVRDGKYTGSLTLKQTDFGITPVKIAGGAVRVKDEIKIEFAIVPASRNGASGANH